MYKLASRLKVITGSQTLVCIRLLFPCLLPKPQFNSNKTFFVQFSENRKSCSSILDFNTVIPLYNWNTIWFMDLIESLIFDFFERTPWCACCADFKENFNFGLKLLHIVGLNCNTKESTKAKILSLVLNSFSSTIYSQIRQARY